MHFVDQWCSEWYGKYFFFSASTGKNSVLSFPFLKHSSAAPLFSHAGPVLGATRAGPRGGCLNTPPLLTRLLTHVEEKEKSVRKLVKNHFETTSVIFSLRSAIRSLEVMKGQNMPFMDIFHEGADYPQNYGS